MSDVRSTGEAGPRSHATGSAMVWREVVVDALGPLAFVAVYGVTGQLLDATWGLLGGSVLSLLASWIVKRKLESLPLTLAIMALISAVLTLAFHSVGILKLEVTIHTAAVGLALVGPLAFGLNPLKAVAGRLLTLTDAAWRTLSLRFGLLNLALAAINVVVWRTQSDAIWAAFKVPGIPIVHVLFLASQLPLIRATRRELG